MTALAIVLGSLLVVAIVVVIRAGRAGPHEAGALHVTGLLHVNVNCSDFERSRAFYEALGFKVLMKVAPDGEGDVAAAVGMERYRVKGALMGHRDGSTIDLLEWQQPREDERPSPQLHRLGLARIALATTDLDADVRRLEELGVELVSLRPGVVPDPLGGRTRFVCFRDPDGTTLELVEMGAAMGTLQRAGKAAARRRAPNL